MTELDRILRARQDDWAHTAHYDALPPGWRDLLWPVQQEVLQVLGLSTPPKGIYCDIPVGGGKFLISLLASHVLQEERAVVLTKPDLIVQSMNEMGKWSKIFDLDPKYTPDFVSYGKLSSAKSRDVLWELRPRLIVMDEAHSLCNLQSARTLRLVDYAVKNPNTRFVVLSGTLQKKSLTQIAHLSELALRDGSWLPLDPDVLEDWAVVLDFKAQPEQSQVKKLDRLTRAMGAATPAEAYSKLYHEHPGVIVAPTTEVRASLTLAAKKPECPAIITKTLKKLSEDWTLPDGTELVDAIEYHRHTKTISLGFYYKPIFESECKEDVDAWLEARRAWSQSIRRQILYIRQDGIDSPMLVEEACKDGRAHPEVREAYRNWCDIRDSVELRSETVWLEGCADALVRGPVERFMRGGSSGIIWYQSRAVGDLLQSRGWKVYGAGSNAPRDSVSWPVCSIRTHGTGKNLQAWDRALVLEPPSGAEAWEQLLGRLHRPGQEADEVCYDVLQWAWPLRSAVYGAIEEAKFYLDREKVRHKLTYCDKVGL